MTLDALYGAGAFTAISQAITGAVPAATVSESSTPSGAYLIISWGQEVCRIDCRADVVHFEYLSTTCNANFAKREGTGAAYKVLCAHLPPLLKGFGVQCLTAEPLDETSLTALLTQAGGFVQDGARLKWVL